MSLSSSFAAVTASFAPADPARGGQALVWPAPPYASYAEAPGASAAPANQGCEVEAVNGHRHQCVLVGLNPVGRTALIRIPSGREVLPLRFATLRRISLIEPLVPSVTPVPPQGHKEREQAHDDLLDYRARVDYTLQLSGGTVRQGQTVGHVENEAGLFLFEPLNDTDAVQRVFYPREAYTDIQMGARIGEVLVSSQVVTSEQIERVVREQENLRSSKLGDYLVLKEIVSPEQLLRALDQQSRMPMVRVGEALVALGLVSEATITAALESQKTDRSVPLGELLVRNGVLSRHDLQVALARKMGFPVVDGRSFPLDANALRKVPFPVAQRMRVLPLLLSETTLVVAAEDPSSRKVIEELEFLTQTKVLTALAAGGDLDAAIRQAYQRSGFDVSAELPSSGDRRSDAAVLAGIGADQLRETLEQESVDDATSETAVLTPQSDNSLVQLINAMVIEAHTQGASDIHIETFHTRRKVRIRFRKDGILVPYMELPPVYRTALVARLKVMCDLDITERRQPQDGKIDFSRFSSQHRLELRVATIPTQGGAEDVVMRILSSAKPLPLEKLGLSPENLRQLQDAVERPYGMVLCVGPTGSGKTTTLHSVLQHLNTPQRKIWTAEDPIEITNPDLRQVQVNPKIDWSFEKALRAFLRADPDIVMVGEIRDRETAQVAVEASLTGHLILSTLHTNSAPETVTRLLDMGLNPFNFADSLLAVLAQRLLRRICSACRLSEPASEEDVALLLQDYLSVFPDDVRPDPEAVHREWLDRFGVEGRLLRYHAPGCPACENTGFKGRVGVHELLLMDAEIRRHILTGSSPDVLRHHAIRSGHFRTLRQDGIEKVLAGHSNLIEVRANCNV